MKIVYVLRSLAVWGGIERIMADKMNHLTSLPGVVVYLLTTDQGTHPLPYRLQPGVHHEDLAIRFHQQYQYRGLQRLRVSRQLKKLFEQRLDKHLCEICPDVIVCTTANYVDIGCIAKLKGNTPLVVESHSICRTTLGHGNSWLKKAINRHHYIKTLSKANVIVTLTEGDAADWRRYHPSVRVIPNVVSLNQGPCSTLNSKRVIFVGRLDYQKQPMEIIHIWKKVWQHFPDWHLDIYGEGELQQKVETAAQSLNMNIHVHQPTSHIFDCYRKSAFLVSTSLFEPFGLVLTEAMSCGLPVVAYDCPFGPADIITNGSDGFLVELNDTKVFADRICQLMADEELRCRIGSQAKDTSRRFSADLIMPQWHQLFNELINNR